VNGRVLPADLSAPRLRRPAAVDQRAGWPRRGTWGACRGARGGASCGGGGPAPIARPPGQGAGARTVRAGGRPTRRSPAAAQKAITVPTRLSSRNPIRSLRVDQPAHGRGQEPGPTRMLPARERTPVASCPGRGATRGRLRAPGASSPPPAPGMT
jgi:hypothetical protein